MVEEKCIFCNRRLIKKHTIVYEDGLVYVIINRYPLSKGHLLIISKKHYRDILTVPNNLVLHAAIISKKVAIMLDSIYKPLGLKIITNIKGSEEVNHFHIHIIPMYGNENYSNYNYKNRKEITEEEKRELVENFRKYKLN